MTKKLLSLIVVAFMVIALLPVGAMAKGGRTEIRSNKLATRDGDVTVTLTAHQVWGADDTSGYQMLLDADASAYGSIIPESGPLSSSGDASADIYAEFEYKIPEAADGSCSTSNIVYDESVSITIPAGTYDWVITNPTPGDRIWIASSNGTAGGGRADNYVFEAGHTYEFVVTLGSDGYDKVDLVYDGEAVEEPLHPMPDGCLWGYYFENDYEFDYIYSFDIDGDENGWGVGDPSQILDAYEGSNVAFSASWASSGDLTPDNWLLFTAPTVPSTGMTVTFYACGVGSWAAEHFAAYAITEADTQDENFPNNLTSLTPVLTEQVATSSWTQYTCDLSAYAGQDIMFALRHYNCTGMYYLFVDQIEFWGEPDVVEPETHTVTFVDGLTNEVISTVEVEDGADATAPAAPEHEGYTFAGWEGSYTNVTDDVTVTAAYTVNSYNLTILYLDENGDKMAATVQYTLPYGTAYSYPSPEFPHYTADTPVVEGTMGAENATVIVTYVIDKYTVTFVDWNGTVLSEQTVPYNGSATAPADPTREGYTFTGWDVAFNNVTSNLTVTAQYEQNAPSEYLKGDVNCDGLVDSADITLAAAYAMSAGSVSAQGVANGDMNGDGLLTAADLSALYGYIQG
ncbi:MAG: DUF2436 domain-containing protein [Clostridia bacterium]|nr:DUF2436 domain-containing protein [Clostridia bacterium]